MVFSSNGSTVDQHDHSQWWTLTCHTDWRNLLEGLDQKLGACRCPDTVRFAIHLALEEAIANAFRHGNRYDPLKVVAVRYVLGSQFFLATVEDEGEGFDPSAIPEPPTGDFLERANGHGLFLMRRYMTWVRFNALGNSVTIYKAW
jgi:serine/threonine-protein kinase RsbW